MPLATQIPPGEFVPEADQRDDRIEVHVLGEDSYQLQDRSTCLPDLDLAWLCSFLDRATVTQAVRDFAARLRG